MNQFKGSFVFLCCFILILGLSPWAVSACGEESSCTSFEVCSQRHAGSRVAVDRCLTPPNTVCCPEALLPYEDCGFESKTRIIHGNITEPADIPWIALLGYRPKNSTSNDPQFSCGGTLISKRYVLTAAHCVLIPALGPPVFVRLGETNLTQNPDCYVASGKQVCEPYRDIEVEKVIPHRSFSSITLKNDIALLRLKTPIERFTDFIKPICLPFDLTIDEENYKYEIAGWGTTDHSHVVGNTILLNGNVFGVLILDCNEKHNIEIDHRQLCAADLEHGVDVAKGDSGGPLFQRHLDSSDHVRVQQFGIVSFRKPLNVLTGFDPAPSVFTKVSAYEVWIKRHLKP